mgnify:CR=1 FL=1
MKVYNWLDKLASEEQGFYAVMNFLRILYELSLYDNAQVLSTSSFAKIEVFSDSRRVQKVQNDTGFFQPVLPLAYRQDAF